MKTRALIIAAVFTILYSSFFIQNCISQWVIVSNGIGYNTVNALFASGNNIVAGLSNNNGIYVSTNYGGNWTQRGLNTYNVLSLAGIGNDVYAGTIGYGIWRSTNYGMNWSLPSVIYTNIYSLAIKYTHIFAGSLNSGVFISSNNGANWTSSSLNDKTVMSLAVTDSNATNDSKRFAGTVGYGIYYSTNNGINWEQTALNNRTVYSIAIRDTFVFAGTEGFGVYLSENNGVNWMQIGLNGLTVRSLAISENLVFAGIENTSANSRGVYMTTNNGVNWTKINEGFSPVPSVYSLLIMDDYIFAGTASNNSVWRRLLSDLTEMQNISTEIPASYSLSQNYPNPFNPVTKISFDVGNGFPIKTLGNDKVVLKIFDITGKEVATIVNEQLAPGTYEVTFDGSGLNSGVYFYRLTTGSYSETKRMMLLK